MSRRIDVTFAIVFVVIMFALYVATVHASTDVQVQVQHAPVAPLEGKFPLQGNDQPLQGNTTKIQGN